ncbi:hypothetical protein Axy18_016 [Achromobacter phage vB_AxyS_19-32_Axy18]|nr:hypothetical protein Axy18_016 [Achromobacter phage vB_AxyS_19-32_Axy18]
MITTSNRQPNGATNMNIIKDLQARIAERLTETKNPCKTYKTEEAAEKAAERMSVDVAMYFRKEQWKTEKDIRPARYVVIYIAEMDRWTYCIDLTELINRESSTGGYLGYCKDIYTF